MPYGGGVAVRITFGESSLPSNLRLASFRLLVTARGLHQTSLEGRGFRGVGATGNSGIRKRHAREPLLYPHAGLLNISGLCREDTPS